MSDDDSSQLRTRPPRPAAFTERFSIVCDDVPGADPLPGRGRKAPRRRRRLQPSPRRLAKIRQRRQDDPVRVRRGRRIWGDRPQGVGFFMDRVRHPERTRRERRKAWKTRLEKQREKELEEFLESGRGARRAPQRRVMASGARRTLRRGPRGISSKL